MFLRIFALKDKQETSKFAELFVIEPGEIMLMVGTSSEKIVDTGEIVFTGNILNITHNRKSTFSTEIRIDLNCYSAIDKYLEKSFL